MIVTADEITSVYNSLKAASVQLEAATELLDSANQNLNRAVYGLVQAAEKDPDEFSYKLVAFTKFDDLVVAVSKARVGELRARLRYDEARADVNRVEALLKLQDAIAHWPNGGQDK